MFFFLTVKSSDSVQQSFSTKSYTYTQNYGKMSALTIKIIFYLHVCIASSHMLGTIQDETDYPPSKSVHQTRCTNLFKNKQLRKPKIYRFSCNI